ncbi:MAG TPA: IS21 family transposase [Enteractinococcus helveticum]|uniref:IS21 family transposase n=1 Tax=Enteractinococcus helveticum TaxID=1837282 RepID=A0A921FK71_9MICC|nr:IS21 family transposase [Enteractinococcus helveticum]HJF13375.1 IS21 family transposase [Enteractinococcus helveticum]
MAKYRQIMELVLQGRSYAEIVEMIGCSRRDVARVRQIVAEHDVTSMDMITTEQLVGWFPDGRKRVSANFAQPDFDQVLVSMRANRFFTVLMAWRRYADADHGLKKPYGYSQFCALFADYVRSHDLVAVLHHEPGRAMLVDWVGPTVDLVDSVTGELTRAYLWVGVLPYSGVISCRAYLNMKSPAWLDAHIQAFAMLDGVPALIVPDNPLTSSHPRSKGSTERVINARYQQLADHYQTAIVPARSGKPRDKAAAENAVGIVEKRVLGYLAEDVFTTMADLNAAIDARVDEINHDMPDVNGVTRWDRFVADEQHTLGALPDTRFEEVEWKQLKVGRNYHIRADSQHYSVPYQLAGRLLSVRLTSLRVTVFDGAVVVCEHDRLNGRKGQYSTLAEHVPQQHQGIDGLWSRAWFTDRARSFGPATLAVITQILDRHAIEAQGYLACQNILEGLGRKNRAVLEAASQQLLNQGGYATYSTIKRIMAAIHSEHDSPRPSIPAASTTKRQAVGGSQQLGPEVYVRDASHYDTTGEEAGL